MDDLARIEAAYGCVAEYNRIKAEEDMVPMSEEELKEALKEQEQYHKTLQALDGVPSTFVMILRSEWDKKKPEESREWNMTELYKWQDYGREKTIDIASRLCEHYGVKKPEDGSFYSSPKGSFSIGLEYIRYAQVFTLAITDLDYGNFKKIYCDLRAAGLNPSMRYMDEEGKFPTLSNCSLGELRYNDLRRYGIETDASIQAAIQAAESLEALSKAAMYIDGLDEPKLHDLLNAGLVTGDPESLYELEEHYGWLFDEDYLPNDHDETFREEVYHLIDDWGQDSWNSLMNGIRSTKKAS